MAKSVRKSAGASAPKSVKRVSAKAKAPARTKKAVKQVVPEVTAPAPTADPVVASSATAAPVTLKSSRRFWLLTLGTLVVVAGLIQFWGYSTGWGNPERLVQRYLNKGQQLTLAKRYDAAIRQYERILKLKTSDENIRQAVIAMADLYRERQDWAKSVELYNQLRQQDPKSVLAAWAGLQIGEAQLLAYKFTDAAKTFAEVSLQFPKSDWDAEARLGIGKAYEKEEKYPEAIAAFEGLVKDYNGGFLAAEALVHIGQCYELKGDLKAARAAYQTILDKYPSTTWDDAKSRLNRLDAGKPGEGVRSWGQPQ